MDSQLHFKHLLGHFTPALKLLLRVASDRESLLVRQLGEFLLSCETKFRIFLDHLFEICVLQGYEVMMHGFILAVF